MKCLLYLLKLIFLFISSKEHPGCAAASWQIFDKNEFMKKNAARVESDDCALSHASPLDNLK